MKILDKFVENLEDEESVVDIEMLIDGRTGTDSSSARNGGCLLSSITRKAQLEF